MDEALIDEPAGSGGDSRSSAPLALYRRYRPDTFADVIGQDHVTDPLRRALANNRVNHAYLFSGPRGCGKTTSARILARALNCEQGPTPTPCGECQSCQDLARGGPGSIDVIEIDAASHGGVDDARDLRERAFFAPVASRYKVYIVDEAHMVTTAGFNAMLKLVEEPPPHVKFVFATTEPEKVIGTIRSRTHHYPFRLVPPRVLSGYLATLCEAEGVPVEPTVLPLVVRAGAGSVRDSLSVLDQLLGGADDDGVSYAQAAALLGYTPDSLLDEIIDAFAAGDGGGVFTAVDKVIEVGQDPRRFAEDLLRRLRDLVIVAAVPDAIDTGLIEVAADQAQRLQAQAAALGQGELTRAAEVIAEGLTEMRGTTAPRLHLELMCSRVLLPGADLDERGFHARLDRLERRVGMTDTGAAGSAVGAPPPTAAPAPPAVAGEPDTDRRDVRPRTEPTPPSPPAGSGPDREPSRPEPASTPPATPPAGPSDRPSVPGGQPSQHQPPAGPTEPRTAPTGTRGDGSLGTADVRRLWPDVLEKVKSRRRFTWILLSQNAHVVDADARSLTLGLSNAGARDNFLRGGSEEVLGQAMVEVFGSQLTITAIIDPGGRGTDGPGPGDGGGRDGGGRGGGGRDGDGPGGRGGDDVTGVADRAPTAPTAPSASGDVPVDRTSTESGAGSPVASGGPAAPGAPAGRGAATAVAERAAAPGAGGSSGPVAAGRPARAAEPAGWETAPAASPPVAPVAPSGVPMSSPADRPDLRDAIRPTRRAAAGANGAAGSDGDGDEVVVDRDDAVVEDRLESHTELLARHLGAEVIDEDPGQQAG